MRALQIHLDKASPRNPVSWAIGFWDDLIKYDESQDKTRLEITLKWKPDPQTLTQLVQVAMQQQKSLESLLDEPIAQYLQANCCIPPVA